MVSGAFACAVLHQAGGGRQQRAGGAGPAAAHPVPAPGAPVFVCPWLVVVSFCWSAFAHIIAKWMTPYGPHCSLTARLSSVAALSNTTHLCTCFMFSLACPDIAQSSPNLSLSCGALWCMQSGDLAAQYIPTMNVIFAAQRAEVGIKAHLMYHDTAAEGIRLLSCTHPR